MALSPSEDIINQMEILEGRHADVHETHKHLRNFFNGHMWEDEQQMTRSLTSVFRDLRTSDSNDREPDIKMTLPFIESIVTKYIAYLCNPPQISMDTPPEGYAGLRKLETRRALADQNEKFLYGLWAKNAIRRHFSRQGFYLPLMGSCFSGVHPDFKNKTIQYLIQSPENAYPLWNLQRTELLAVGFKFELPLDIAVRTFGESAVKLLDDTRFSLRNLMPGWKGDNVKTLTCIEWYDDHQKQILLQGQRVSGVEHNLGFCPWEETRFYDVPDEDFGKGVIEGNVPLFQKLNMLDSLELQAVIENVFARMVIINPSLAPEDIDNSPGGVIPVGQGGDVKWIGPPEVTADLTKSMARSMEFVERGTHIPPAAYGEGVASSITTGKAQHEATLPTGNMVEYVQGNISDTWESLNEKAIDMTETIFKNRKVVFFGRQFESAPGTLLSALEKPARFEITLAGSDLKGWTSHQLTFQPLLNLHEKIVMGLQLGGGGLVSKRWQRDQIGIADNNAMAEEILQEQLVEINVAGMLAQAQQGAIDPLSVENSFLAMEKGSYTPVPSIPTAPAGLAAAGLQTPPGALPPGMPAPGPAAPAMNPGDMGPDLGLPEVPAGAPEPPEATGQFTLQQAVDDFSRIKKLKGEVWLVGEIVQRGATDGDIEVDVTEMLDKATIINGLPDKYHGYIKVHPTQGVPEEPNVQVGPGHTDATVNGSPLIDHPDTVTRAGGAEPNPSFQETPALPSYEPPLATYFPAGGFQGSIRS